MVKKNKLWTRELLLSILEFWGEWVLLSWPLKFKKKEISVQQAIECTINRAKQVNPTINAIAQTDFDQLIHTTSPTQQKGIFSGVPTFVKDLIDVEGHPTRRESRATSKS